MPEAAKTLVVGRGDATPADVIALADGRSRAVLDTGEEYVARIDRGAALAQRRAEAEARAKARDGEEPDVSRQSALRDQFTRYHSCGVGAVLSDREAAAVVAARLLSLARGYSGVRRDLLALLCDMVNRRVLPRIPALGSSGANADLVPLSYLVSAIVGERDVSYLGRVVPAEEGLKAARLEPMDLRPKEALALMSGTGLMTALGCLAWDRARRFARFAVSLNAMTLDMLGCSVGHLDQRIGALKPHAGSSVAAEWLREDVEYGERESTSTTPAPELLRAGAHVVGALLDATRFADELLQVEINAVCDQPIVHPASGEMLLSGHYYGGHVALALDGIKTALLSSVGYLEQTLAVLCEPTHSGLPRDLSPRGEGSGFRAMRTVASSLVTEVARMAVPAALYGRNATRSVSELPSMGTHAARDCLTALDHAETLAAIVALAACQAVDLRDGEGCRRRSKAVYGAVRQLVPRLEEDRAQDRDITSVLELFRAGLLPVGKDA